MASKTRGKGEGGLSFDKTSKMWEASIELPPRDGKRRRRKVRAREKTEVLRRLRALQQELAERGDLPTADMTVERWFEIWLDKVVRREVAPKTAAGYRSNTYRHILPLIGSVRLANVTPTHLRTVTDHMVDELGLSPTSANQAFRVMSSAFEVATRERHMSRNPAKMMNAPKKARPELEAFDLDESVAMLDYVLTDKAYGARWAMALLTGARRGEVIGLEANRVGEELDLSWQLQRITWAHGCGEPTKVGRRRLWPCGHGQGALCEERRLDLPHDYEHRRITDGLYWTRPKSAAGDRLVPLVEPLRGILFEHMARNPPGSDGLVFRWHDRPVDPDQDSRRWVAVLEASGVADKHVRLHDLRHTAIDLLDLAGVPDDVIAEIVGHASVDMVRRYKKKRNLAKRKAAMEAMSALLARGAA